MEELKQTIRIATRGSRLALAQTRLVQEELEALGYQTEPVIAQTMGDKNRRDALSQIGGNGVFVRELEKLLLEGRADIAVHSAKDMPAVLPPGLIIAAAPEAGRYNDMLILNKGIIVQKGTVIGTGSARRRSVLKRLYPDITVKDIRGNIDTRLEKLRSKEYDGIVLAAAGIERLDLEMSEFDICVFSTEMMLPSPAQGIIAIEANEKNQALCKVLSEKICHSDTFYRLMTERTLLECLQAGCATPVGALAEISGEEIRLTAELYDKRACEVGNIRGIRELCEKIILKLQ